MQYLIKYLKATKNKPNRYYACVDEWAEMYMHEKNKNCDSTDGHYYANKLQQTPQV
jgi:hypothetical protein